MREIKFRAWVYGSGIPRMIEGKDIDAIEWCNDKLWHHNGEYTLLGNLELMQFTGLKDKSGKEIYEGDIMDYGNKRYYPVVFNSGKFHMKPLPMEWLLPMHLIIGNIYESPELIKP